MGSYKIQLRHLVLRIIPNAYYSTVFDKTILFNIFTINVENVFWIKSYLPNKQKADILMKQTMFDK